MDARDQSPFDFTAPNGESRFQVVNRERLRRIQACSSARQREFLELLPLLFHFNHPLLPGYVAKDTPCGLRNYTPTHAALRAARRASRSFELDRRAPPRYALRGLYLIGSPGSVAYARGSDLDLWLVHDPELPAAALAELHEKTRRVEAAAATLGLEMHFFVFDADRFRAGETLSLSAESSGSSQHSVLLDEFYRSGVLLAGLPPLWWRVPACYDARYDEYARAAAARRLLDPRDYIDFGGLAHIPAEEFLGAAVWQLYKSIESPYKSVLKLLLMESYASSHPHTTLLSTRYKEAVEGGEADLDRLDPYVLMLERIEAHLAADGEAARLDVARRCFYLKADVRVSELALRGDPDWRGDLMQRLVRGWGWSPGRVVLLDQRELWHLPVAMDERRDLSATLKESYARLSRLARTHAAELKISARDLDVLGRKLYCAFERKPGKIDIITRGICANPREDSLSLHELRGSGAATSWVLYAGAVSPVEAAQRRPLKRAAAVSEILYWCHLNRIADTATRWHVHTVGALLDHVDLRRMLQQIGSTFGAADDVVEVGDVGQPPRLARALLLVNVGVNPFAGSLAGGDVLTSDRNDAFLFGGRRRNLVSSVDLLYVTSWNEAFAFRYAGAGGVPAALAECAGWLPSGLGNAAPPRLDAVCLSPDHATSITRRVQETFARGLRALGQRVRGHAIHLVFEIGDSIQHLKLNDNGVTTDEYASTAALMRVLGQASGPGFNAIRFDAGVTRTALLAALYRRNRPGVVQICADVKGQQADVFVLDERGVLLVQRQACHTPAALFHHYRLFLAAACGRLHHLGLRRDLMPPLECTLVVRKIGAVELEVHADRGEPHATYLPLKVLADADADGRQHFTILVGEHEFTSFEHGKSLFGRVAAHVLTLRRHHAPYPIYITDLDISARCRQVLGMRSPRTLDLLAYKKRIEHELTRALDHLATDPAFAAAG